MGKTNDLKQSLTEIETMNQELNERSELQQHEVDQYVAQLAQVQKSNREFAERLEVLKNEKLQGERVWFDKEEDLRNEVHIIRNQLHDTTNALGMMKLDMLEKDTLHKKLQNEIDGLNEELLFYKECQQKDKKDKSMLNEQLSDHNKCHNQKMNDIKMILEAKTVRIMQLQEDNETKSSKIKQCESQIIELQNQISSTKSMMMREEDMKQTLQNEKEEEIVNGNKLLSIFDDLSRELSVIKSEKSKLFVELDEQKHVNVQLSLELDSMQQYVDKSIEFDNEDANLDNNDYDNDDEDVNEQKTVKTKSAMDDT